MTIKSLEGVEAADFGNRLFAQWGVGHKADDRGLLILLAISDRKYWVEVGYGLEPILPDGKVGAFGREMVPLLRQGDYNRAILQLTESLADVIASKIAGPIGPPSSPNAAPASNDSAAPPASQAQNETAFDEIFPFVWYGSLYLGYFVAGGIGLFHFVKSEERKKYFLAAIVLLSGLVLLGYIRGQDFLISLLVLSAMGFLVVGFLVSLHLAERKNRSTLGWGILSLFFGSFALLTIMHLRAKPPKLRKPRNRFFSLFGVGDGDGRGWGGFGGSGSFGGFGGGASGGGGAGGHW